MDSRRHITANPFGGWDVLDPDIPGSLGNFPTIEQAKAVAEGSLLRAGGGYLVIHLPGADEEILIEEPGLADLLRD